jgi:PAS domain S-box-containing protein
MDANDQERLESAILDTLDRLVVVLDRAGRIIRFNRAAEQASGRTREQLLGKMFWTELSPGAEPATLREQYGKIVAGQLPIEHETHWVTDSGMRRVIAWRVTPVRDAAGQFCNLVCTGTDVTDRMPEAMRGPSLGPVVRDQASVLRLVLENMGDGIAVADRDGRFLLYTRAAERIIGAAPVRMGFEQWSAHFGFFLPDGKTPYPPDDLPLQRALRGESSDDTEIFVRNAHHVDGAWISITGRPIRDESGQLSGGVAVVRDLTERKRAEEAVRLSEARFRLLVEQAPISVQILSPAGATLQVNEAFSRLFGVTLADLSEYRILDDPQLATNGILPYLQRAFAGELVKIPAQPYVPDRGQLKGQTRWVGATAFAITQGEGGVQQVVILHEDISEQRQAEENLRRSEQHFRELADHNRLLAQEVEHRVGNNLAGLLGLVEVMEQRATDVPTFAAAVKSRLTAMAHVHRMLSEAGWGSIELRRLLQSLIEVLAPMARHETRTTIEGPPVEIVPRHALPLAMVFVEWFTNSTKYGAHSNAGGQLRVDWKLADEAGARRLRLHWIERGGPPIDRPVRRSLGTELVESFVRRELGGKCELRYPREGADHVIEFQLDPVPSNV